MTSFYAELKRRNVLRVAATYAVVAWIIIEAGSVLLPTFGASPATFQMYVIAVLGGFVVALILAWVFEITPEGVKLEKNVDRSGSITAKTGRKLDLSIIGLLVIALGISVTLNVTGMRNSEPESVATAVDRMSIAVLPFESRSTDPENELFADGIHDDLLTRLANVGALKVISRTSVMEYRNTTKKTEQIAAELGVGSLVQGTVQRIGDKVRIYAQLIDAATDEHLWADTFDRQLSVQNIFKIQSEISEAITGALRATLTTKEHTRLAAIPTESMEAYRLTMQGRANLYERRLEMLLQAREQFEQAAVLDPNYADAYAGLAESVILLFNNHAAVSLEELLAVAEPALEKALAIDPELADAYASLGLLKHQIWSETRSGPELDEAVAAQQRAIELNENHAQAYMWFATVRTDQQRYDEAIELYNQALRIDPLGRIPYANLPGLYAQLNRNEEAIGLYVEAVRIHPEWPTAYLNLSLHLQGLGRLDESIAWGIRGQELSTDPLAGASLIASYVDLGDYEQARNVLPIIPVGHPMHELGNGMDQILEGDFSAASTTFENIVSSSDNPRQFLFSLIAGTAMLAGDFDKAREYTERRNPDFSGDEDPTIDRFNVSSIIQYAYILQNQGEKRRAEALLASALPVVRSLPRIGIAGHGIRDVQILALQGKSYEALTTMQEAIDDGFRGTTFTNGWPLALDPYLESIRERPEFLDMGRQISTALSFMRERVAGSEASGNWDVLRSLVDGV